MTQLPDISLTTWQASSGVCSNVGVLCLHGIESHARWFATFASALNSHGIDCHAYDRAHSGTRQNPYKTEFDSSAYHLAELAAAMKAVGERNDRVVVVGMSWGGLLALHAVQRNMMDAFKVLLIAPGIFPARPLPLNAIANAVVGGLVGGPRVPLPYEAIDFSRMESVQRFIAEDPLRRKKVSTKLLLTTLAMQKEVRRGLSGEASTTVEVWLPDEDRIIDLAETHAFFEKHQVPVHAVKGQSHCLILECPSVIASAVADLIEGGK